MKDNPSGSQQGEVRQSENLELFLSTTRSTATRNGSVRSRKIGTLEEVRDAIEVLVFLNTKAGRQFRFVPRNLEFIVGRLRSGITVAHCKGVIARQVRDWKDDPKMMKYLRPETLFNETKFESYLGMNDADA